MAKEAPKSKKMPMKGPKVKKEPETHKMEHHSKKEHAKHGKK